MINYVLNRTQTWHVDEIFKYELEAKRKAAKLFVNNSGVAVKPFHDGTYMVMTWDRERRFDEHTKGAI